METEAKKSDRRLGVIVLLLAVVAVAAFILFAPPDRSDDEMIGHVNHESVTLQRFEEEILLQRVRNRMANRPDQEDNPGESLNQLIRDLLMLQEAAEMEVAVEQAEVDSEIEAVLNRVNTSRAEMNELLADEGLDWDVFERSIRDYLTLDSFLEDVLLAEVPSADRGIIMRDWISQSYALADIEFDEDFLEEINTGNLLLTQGQEG